MLARVSSLAVKASCIKITLERYELKKIPFTMYEVPNKGSCGKKKSPK